MTGWEKSKASFGQWVGPGWGFGEPLSLCVGRATALPRGQQFPSDTARRGSLSFFGGVAHLRRRDKELPGSWRVRGSLGQEVMQRAGLA
jgi:hypothetical protein